MIIVPARRARRCAKAWSARARSGSTASATISAIASDAIEIDPLESCDHRALGRAEGRGRSRQPHVRSTARGGSIDRHGAGE